MKSLDSMNAKKEIIEKIESGDNNTIFMSVRIDNNSDFEVRNDIIILSYSCFLKIKSLYNEVLSNQTQERGTLFYGKRVGKYIIFDKYKSDFKLANISGKNLGVELTPQNIQELTTLIDYKGMNKEPYNCIMNFHIHPSYGETREGLIMDINDISLKYSDQDLLSYGRVQKPLHSEDDVSCLYLGGLLSVNYGIEPKFNVVMYDPDKKDFYNLTSIYFMNHNQLYRLNRNNITESKLLNNSDLYKVTSSVKTYNESHNNKVHLN